MPILRVLVAAAPAPAQEVPWALYDEQDRLVRSGHGASASWPAASRREAVLAASAVRIARVVLPPMPADRVAAAAAYALEDRLAGPAQAQHLVASARQRDGTVDVAIAARELFAPLARDFTRVVAEPSVAPVPAAGTWRWYGGGGGSGFVRRPDGSAFAVSDADDDSSLPPELALALAHAARAPAAPTRVEVGFGVRDAALAAWSRESGVAFERGPVWRWDQDGAALASATDLLQGDFGRTRTDTRHDGAARWKVAGIVAAGALVLHVLATVTQWAVLRYDLWQTQRAVVAAAREAGIADAGESATAAAALRERFVQARHRAGRVAPADALPLLARATPALAALPAGTLKSATYATGTWTLELARLEPDVLDRLERALGDASLAIIAAPNATGVRMRLGPRPGTELP